MAITKDDVVTIAPELSGVDDETFDAYIADALLELDISAFGDAADLAHKLQVAHSLTVAGLGSGTAAQGPVSSMSVGSVSVSYAVESLKAGDASLSSTRYGLRLQQLRRRLGMRLAVVG